MPEQIEVWTKPSGAGRNWLEIGKFFKDKFGDVHWRYRAPRYPNRDPRLKVKRSYHGSGNSQRIEWKIIIPLNYPLVIYRKSGDKRPFFGTQEDTIWQPKPRSPKQRSNAMPVPACYLYLYKSTETLEDLQAHLAGVFPSIIHAERITFHTHIAVERSLQEERLTTEEQGLVDALGAKAQLYQSSGLGEWEALRAEMERSAEETWEVRLAVLVQEGARYFVCEFTQNQRPGFENDLYVRSVQPGDYSEYDQAQQEASACEEALHRLDDWNVVVVARLARSREEAIQGRFLDE